MTIQELIDILEKLPDKHREVFVLDPYEEVSGEIRNYVQDIYTPSNNKEVYLIVDFG